MGSAGPQSSWSAPTSLQMPFLDIQSPNPSQAFQALVCPVHLQTTAGLSPSFQTLCPHDQGWSWIWKPAAASSHLVSKLPLQHSGPPGFPGPICSLEPLATLSALQGPSCPAQQPPFLCCVRNPIFLWDGPSQPCSVHVIMWGRDGHSQAGLSSIPHAVSGSVTGR